MLLVVAFVDVANAGLIWTELGSGRIVSADDNGGSQQVLVSGTFPIGVSYDGLDSPRDIIFVSSGVRAPSTIILLLVGGVALAIPRTRAVSGTAPATPPSQWGSPTAHGST